MGSGNHGRQQHRCGDREVLGPGAPQETLKSSLKTLRCGGHLINIGAVAGEGLINLHYTMDNDQRFGGSGWFTAGWPGVMRWRIWWRPV